MDYFIAGNSTNSRGVMIMINNSFEYKVNQCIRDPEGRYVIIELSIANLINVYCKVRNISVLKFSELIHFSMLANRNISV